MTGGRDVWSGKILIVDLSERKVEEIATGDWSRLFVGGRGVNAGLVLSEVKKGADPLGPDNAIILGTGPLTGTLFPGSSRLELTTRSPMSGFLGSSNMGGHFAAELKYAGYDHVVVKGVSATPVYLYIHDGGVEIRDASHLWGQDMYTVPVAIRRELREPEAKILGIGRAGEKLVRFAAVVSRMGNAAGRTGMGAVMGSKKLKAIACRGTGGVKIAHPDRFLEHCRYAHQLVTKSDRWAALQQNSQATASDNKRAKGLTPARNMATTEWATRQDVSIIRSWSSRVAYRRTGCMGCPLQCMENYYPVNKEAGIVSCEEFTDLIDNLLLDDFETWWSLSVMCNKQGVDPISLSGMLAWAMELFERQIITEKDTDGVRLEWGNGPAILEMAEMVVERRGFGGVLADGILDAAAAIGPDTIQYASQVKGIPMYTLNHQTCRGAALAAAVGPRGDVIRGFPWQERQDILEPDQEVSERWRAYAKAIAGTEAVLKAREYLGKARLVKYQEDVTAVCDILGYCKWLGQWTNAPVEPRVALRAMEAGLGREVLLDELLAAVERTRCTERAFDCREGMTRDHDKLPRKFFEKPMEGRFSPDTLDEDHFEEMKTAYYLARGWDPATGVPTRQTLIGLGLARQYEELNKYTRVADGGELPAMIISGVRVEQEFLSLFGQCDAERRPVGDEASETSLRLGRGLT